MNIVERFLGYVKFDTQSAEDSTTTPSTEKQLVFANFLENELKEIGLKDVEQDDNGYIYATLPENTKTNAPTIGFIAHYDTSPDCSGANVKPRIIENYDGKDITLSETDNIVLSTTKFPELSAYKGETLIVTDGHTLLGADDKAGIAEIVEAMVYLIEHPEIKHGNIRVAFNPDEEIGLGAHHFDVEKFGCQWAYTMDGSEVGEIEYENFNAATAKIKIKGVSVHPGYAKGKMVNAARVASQIINTIPSDETPEHTEGYEGFFHLTEISGSVEAAKMVYIIRDHDRSRFEAKKKVFRDLVNSLNAVYGENTIDLSIEDSYYNMKEKVEPVMHVIDIAIKAMEKAGVSPKVKAIRGGTDGAQLSFKGLPCPNIFAGGVNFHGPYEFVSVESMEKAKSVIVKIAEITSLFNK